MLGFIEMPVEIEQAIPFRHVKKLRVPLCTLCVPLLYKLYSTTLEDDKRE